MGTVHAARSQTLKFLRISLSLEDMSHIEMSPTFVPTEMEIQIINKTPI